MPERAMNGWKDLAGCVIANDQQEILLIHRNTPELVQWELPGGKINEGETPELAAGRELYEELGLIVTGLRKIKSVTFQQSGQQYHYTWFWPNQVHGEPKVQEDIHDAIDYFAPEVFHVNRWFSPNVIKLMQYSRAGKIEF